MRSAKRSAKRAAGGPARTLAAVPADQERRPSAGGLPVGAGGIKLHAFPGGRIGNCCGAPGGKLAMHLRLLGLAESPRSLMAAVAGPVVVNFALTDHPAAGMTRVGIGGRALIGGAAQHIGAVPHFGGQATVAGKFGGVGAQFPQRLLETAVADRSVEIPGDQRSERLAGKFGTVVETLDRGNRIGGVLRPADRSDPQCKLRVPGDLVGHPRPLPFEIGGKADGRRCRGSGQLGPPDEIAGRHRLIGRARSANQSARAHTGRERRDVRRVKTVLLAKTPARRSPRRGGTGTEIAHLRGNKALDVLEKLFGLRGSMKRRRPRSTPGSRPRIPTRRPNSFSRTSRALLPLRCAISAVAFSSIRGRIFWKY